MIYGIDSPRSYIAPHSLCNVSNMISDSLDDIIIPNKNLLFTYDMLYNNDNNLEKRSGYIQVLHQSYITPLTKCSS